ncbi:METTL21A_2 [Blepharisma stoltei]|uniref:Uncharacterized protein n=1 Tax=Blepharisma stoltei TaxID=1481888 RepID=A0AAU9IE07_9CILI|nr:unnamed protein product [Blepharisma stoltei]
MDCTQLALYTPPIHQEMLISTMEYHFENLSRPLIKISQCLEPGSGVGGAQWNAGLVLARYLSKEIQIKTGKSIELGCGLGLISIVLSIMGFQVTATDGNYALLNWTRRNFEANLNDSDRWSIEHLIWGENEHIREKSLEEWDLIVGADVLYGEYASMIAFINTLISLSRSETKIYVAQQIRYPDSEEIFLNELKKSFEIEIIKNEEFPNIVIYKLAKINIPA